MASTEIARISETKSRIDMTQSLSTDVGACTDVRTFNFLNHAWFRPQMWISVKSALEEICSHI